MVVGWIPLLAPAVAGASTVGRRLHRYPGGTRFAFGSEYAPARRDLHTARDALRPGTGGTAGAARQDLDAAHARRHALTGHRPR